MKQEPYVPEIKSVVVCTISMCTRRCWHCAHGVHPPAKHILSEKLATKIIDDLASVGYEKRLSFFCGNEPLLDPRLEDFFRYASKKLPCATLTLVSNGDLATRNVLKRLFDSGMQKIIISLHSYERKPDFVDYQNEFGKDRLIVSDHASPTAITGFHNFGGLIKSDKVSQTRYPHSGCALPFKQLVVYPDYTLGLCCVDTRETIRIQVDESESIVETFFNSDELNKFRLMLGSNQRNNDPCANCSYIGRDYFD